MIEFMKPKIVASLFSLAVFISWGGASPADAQSGYSLVNETIPLPASMVKALSEHRKRQAEERLRAGSAWQDHGLVFTTTVGGPLNISKLTRNHFKPALKRAGLPQSVRLYDLRHTCATLLL